MPWLNSRNKPPSSGAWAGENRCAASNIRRPQLHYKSRGGRRRRPVILDTDGPPPSTCAEIPGTPARARVLSFHHGRLIEQVPPPVKQQPGSAAGTDEPTASPAVVFSRLVR